MDQFAELTNNIYDGGMLFTKEVKIHFMIQLKGKNSHYDTSIG